MLEQGIVVAGKYQLERQLGEGGMGVVWLARHVELGEKRVAIKFLLNSLSKMLLERFHREAQLASRIQSRHVVQVLDYGSYEGAPYLVMECLGGHDLRHLLDEKRRLEPSLVVDIIRQSARGLQKAHDAGMIHRDIKPENLFLCRDEDGGMLVKILDFGIAKSLEADSGTATGMMIGTAYYMSPEQYQGLKQIDRTTDLWALGCVAYEMLVGAKVFNGDSVVGIGMVILSQNRPVPSQIAPGLPPAFDAWFAKALHSSPASRFGSAIELAESLAAALTGNYVGTVPAVSPASQPVTAQSTGNELSTTAAANSEFTPSRKRGGSRTQTIAGVAAVAIVASASVVGMLVLRSARSETLGSPAVSLVAAVTEPLAPSPSASAQPDILDKASALVTGGDIIGAHRLVAEISASSELRKDLRYIGVENAWADQQLSKAESEADPAEKRRMITEVSESGADEPRRTRARAMLEALSTARPGTRTAKPSSPAKTPAPEPAKPAAAQPAAATPAPPPAGLPPRF